MRKLQDDFFRLLLRYGTPPNVTLDEVAADVFQSFDLLRFFHALRDDVEAHDVPHGDDGGNVLSHGIALVHLVDERLVDLQKVCGEVVRGIIFIILK